VFGTESAGLEPDHLSPHNLGFFIPLKSEQCCGHVVLSRKRIGVRRAEGALTYLQQFRHAVSASLKRP
jgi:hypothetical protein